jgi:hypothetical protein
MTQQALATQKQNQGQQMSIVEGNFQRNSIAKLNMRELKELAEVFVTSKMFPDVTQTAQAMVKIIAGQELGFEPIVSMTGIHIFQGKVSIGANLLASLIKDSGKYQYKVTEHDNTACTVVFYQDVRGDWKQLGVPVRYTMQDAQNAGLTSKDVWKKYPSDMLFASVIRKGCRRYCADVLRGTVSDHDVADEVNLDARAAETAQIATEAAEYAHDGPEYSGLSNERTEEVNDADAIDAEPFVELEPDVAAEDPITKAESQLADLHEACKELLREITNNKAAETQKILNGRSIGSMDLKQAELFYNELLKLKG